MLDDLERLLGSFPAPVTRHDAVWDDGCMSESLSEFGVIRQICNAQSVVDNRVLIGPGDDLALVHVSAPGDSTTFHDRALVGVDQLVDGIHVDLDEVSLEQAGRKAVCRSLSDVAAMAGRPVATVVSAVVPKHWTHDDSMSLFNSMRSTSEIYHSPLVGGDLAVHRDGSGRLICSVTVVAAPARNGVVTRFDAKPGDGLYVTGCLGGSWRTGHHLEFVPRLAESAMLLAILGDRLHAMIDISDGLGRDAAHMVEQSELQIVVEGELLPCRTGFGVENAIADGEDYELLFAASGDVPDGLGECPVTRIGVFREKPDSTEGPVLLDWDGHVRDISRSGWEHESS